MDFSSEEEMESFEMTGNEFRKAPKRSRKRRKEERIYGQWAESDEDEDNSKRMPLYGDYSNFVKSGDADDDDGSGGSDQGATDQALDEEALQILKGYEQRSLDKEEVDPASIRGFKSAAIKKNKNLGAFESTSRPTQSAGVKSKAGRSRPGPSTGKIMEKDFGKWERFTSGFGSKMLAKMGWRSGQGLGSKGVGIVNPVKATKHTDFGKGLAHMQISKGASTAVDSEDEAEQKEFEQQLQQWKKSDGRHKPKYTFKTVEELMKSGKSAKSSGGAGGKGSVKVIDLTGPQQRVLSSYEEIHDHPSRPDEQVKSKSTLYLHEMLHNVQLLVDHTEQDLLKSDRKLRHNRDLILNLSYEKEELSREVTEEDQQVEKLAEILELVEICESRITGQGPPLTLDYCQSMLADLKERYPLEYTTYNLSSMAVALVFPLIKQELKDWDCLEAPEDFTQLFHDWKALLKERESAHTMPSADQMDPYDRLVWEVWMPRLRRRFQQWSPKDCSSVIDLLELWSSLLPLWVIDNILDQLVLPRLQREVTEWDPTTDPVPIHTWTHPWLPLLKSQMESLFIPIRHKLARALNNWHPSDSSAYNVLKPWANVFSPPTMEAFLLRTIVPKLSYCLQLELQINPHQQKLAPFEWVMTWRDMLSAQQYASMLDKNFFPKWTQVLSTWLQQNPNFDEVTRWYKGWKGQLDDEILREPSVKHYLNMALDMMNRAVSGNYQPGARENMAYFTTNERRSVQATQNAVTAPASVSFKDLIEKLAEERGVLFMPVPGQKRHEGKALYNFGRATLYIDRGVSFVLDTSTQTWRPVSLDNLINYS